MLSDAAHRILLAKALVSTARTEEAEELLAQILESDQTNADALCGMGEEYNQAGSSEKALEMSNAALMHRPGMKAALLQKRIAHGRLGELDHELAAVSILFAAERETLLALPDNQDLRPRRLRSYGIGRFFFPD